MSIENFGYKQELKRSLSFWDLLIYGMIFMVPIAPFGVFGYVLDGSKGMVALAYLIGMAGMIFTAFSYARMSEAFPISGSSLTRTENKFWKPVFIGSGLSFLATIVTWFIVVAIISAVSAPELAIQAGTGLLANIVLLIVMNWFFHNVYWTGWIKHHNKRKQMITDAADGQYKSQTFFALIILGFTAVYREGFEVVLFLQNLRLQVGSLMILYGTLIGLFFTLIVGWLTFIAHTRLPYRKMLILTGVLLGVVLLVMIGETTFEMQQAGWIATTNLPIKMPDWLGIWLSIFPNVQTLSSQLFAIIFVVGSYYASRYVKRKQQAQKASVSS